MISVLKNSGKKGALPIYVFVILTLIVCVSTLFVFLTNPPQVEATFRSLDSFDEVYSQESVVNFYLEEVFEESFVKTYRDFVLNGDYLGNVRITESSKGEVYYISGINNNIKNDFGNTLEDNFKKNFLKKDFEKDYLNDLQREIEKDNFEIFFNENSVEVVIDSFVLKSNKNEISVNYTPELKKEINLTRFGLESFQEIIDFGNACSEFNNITEKKSCYDNKKSYFENFEFDYKEESLSNEKELILELKSKKEFYFEEDFDKMRFSFVSD